MEKLSWVEKGKRKREDETCVLFFQKKKQSEIEGTQLHDGKVS